MLGAQLNRVCTTVFRPNQGADRQNLEYKPNLPKFHSYFGPKRISGSWANFDHFWPQKITKFTQKSDSVYLRRRFEIKTKIDWEQRVFFHFSLKNTKVRHPGRGEHLTIPLKPPFLEMSKNSDFRCFLKTLQNFRGIYFHQFGFLGRPQRS